MIRPDAMDRDVAALLGLDAVMFAPPVKAPPRAPRKPARPAGAAPGAGKTRKAQRSPWPWVIAPLTVALVVGVGLTWRSGERTQPERPEQTAERTEQLELRPSQPSRAMSLKVIDGPDRPPRRRPQNFPAWQIDPSMANIAPPETEVAQAPVAPPEPAPEARILDVEPMSLFSDPELAPGTQEPYAEAPEPDPAL